MNHTFVSKALHELHHLYRWLTVCSIAIFFRKPLEPPASYAQGLSRVFKGYLERKVLENEVNNIYIYIYIWIAAFGTLSSVGAPT